MSACSAFLFAQTSPGHATCGSRYLKSFQPQWFEPGQGYINLVQPRVTCIWPRKASSVRACSVAMSDGCNGDLMRPLHHERQPSQRATCSRAVAKSFPRVYFSCRAQSLM